MGSEDLSSPLFKWAHMILDYTTLVTMGAAFVTQALSMAGIAASTNMMVWGYGGMALGLAQLAWGVMTFLQHWNCWKLLKDDADGDDDIDDANPLSLIGEIESDWMMVGAAESAAALVLWQYMEAWMVAQWYALPEDERQAAWEEHEAEKDGKMGGDDKKEMMLNRMFRF